MNILKNMIEPQQDKAQQKHVTFMVTLSINGFVQNCSISIANGNTAILHYDIDMELWWRHSISSLRKYLKFI